MKREKIKLFHCVWAAIVGFVAGLIARAVLPGYDRMGLIGTAIVRIPGSFVGG